MSICSHLPGVVCDNCRHHFPSLPYTKTYVWTDATPCEHKTRVTVSDSFKSWDQCVNCGLVLTNLVPIDINYSRVDWSSYRPFQHVHQLRPDGTVNVNGVGYRWDGANWVVVQ